MRETEVKELTADLDLLVVMPGAGEYGYYTDWRNGGEGGPPMWETFHLVELRQLLERNFGVDDHRLVAGLSMGGFGAMSRLDALHIPVTAVSGPGTHTWPYWQRALREALPILLEAIRS